MCRCRGRAVPGQKIFSIEPSVLYVKAVEKRGGTFGLGDVASDAGGDFVQTYTEKGFRGNDKEWESMCIPFGEDAKICLNGVIDRVDLCSLPGEELIKIIDYKSSDSQDLLLAKVYYGL